MLTELKKVVFTWKKRKELSHSAISGIIILWNETKWNEGRKKERKERKKKKHLNLVVN